MAKFVVKESMNEVVINRKIGWRENYNDRELKILLENNISGIVKPEINVKMLKYGMSDCILLNKYLVKGIEKNAFYRVVLQCIDVIKNVETYGLNINNLILNQQYIGINTTTNEVFFVYQPVINKEVKTSIYTFLKEITFSVKCLEEQDLVSITEFSDFLKKIGEYSSIKIEEFIKKEFSKKEISKEKELKENNVYQPFINYDEILYVDDDDDDTGTFGGFGYKEPTGKNTFFKNDNSKNVNSDSPYSINIDCISECFEYEPTERNDDYEDMEATVVLDEVPVVTYPYLIRRVTKEKIVISNSVFRLGRDKRVVDYWIKDNKAVSGSHADIFMEDLNYYVRDNHSTNKTYVNGIKLDSEQSVQLKDNDLIMLADEVFEFHL